jgi:hypothetical protein
MRASQFIREFGTTAFALYLNMEDQEMEARTFYMGSSDLAWQPKFFYTR